MSQMRLHGMLRSLKERLERPDHQDLSFADLFSLVVDDEWNARESRRLTSRLRTAQFKEKNACIEDIDYRASRGLKKSLVLELAKNQWIDKKQNITITGPSGAGKSYLAQALGHQACRDGHTVMYLRFPKLLVALGHAKADGSYGEYLAKIAKTRLLILDDLGLSPLEEPEQRDLLEIVEDRYGVGSTIITSQLPVAAWHPFFGGERIADAICDRLLHNAFRVELTGDSIRKERAGLTLTQGDKSEN
jgi:DNA replication protein DnaC